jgi:hypothetical protein
VPEDWYAQARDRIISSKVLLYLLSLSCNKPNYLVKDARIVISFHGNSIPKTLSDLFPEIGLQETEFQVRQSMVVVYNNTLSHCYQHCGGKKKTEGYFSKLTPEKTTLIHAYQKTGIHNPGPKLCPLRYIYLPLGNNK